jgi:FkbM family methyltransferase
MKELLAKLRRYGLWVFIKFGFSELKSLFYNQMILGSYSQFQEDLYLDKITGCKKSGFYVDVGAYDPFRFSNTMRFYKKGWRGISIEPDTSRWSKFQIHRTRDVNLNIGVGKEKKNLTYYRIDPPTLSTFDSKQAEAYEKQGFALLGKTTVAVLPLSDILEKYAKKTPIDFMSIDVEGMEMQVLASNNWKLYRPHFICIESADFSDTKDGKKNYQSIEGYLNKVGYVKSHDNGLNAFYKNIK